MIKIFDLHLDGLFNFRFGWRLSSFHFLYYPLLFWWAKRINRNSGLSHIYTSLGDLPFLTLLKKKPIVLTSAAPCPGVKLRKRIKFLKRLDQVIVETETDCLKLLKYGLNPNKVKLIYPPVNLEKFTYHKNQKESDNTFRILYATCPEKKRDFRIKGWYLLLKTVPLLERNMIFDCPWRYNSYSLVKKMIHPKIKDKINLYFSIEREMNKKYGEVDCTIIPYTERNTFVKQIPNSAIESLAAGKPILVSSKVEMAKIVERERCGIVFEPNPESLAKAIEELKKRYDFYQKNCRKTAEKYFSQDRFIEKYEQVYNEVMVK